MKRIIFVIAIIIAVGLFLSNVNIFAIANSIDAAASRGDAMVCVTREGHGCDRETFTTPSDGSSTPAQPRGCNDVSNIAGAIPGRPAKLPCTSAPIGEIVCTLVDQNGVEFTVRGSQPCSDYLMPVSSAAPASL